MTTPTDGKEPKKENTSSPEEPSSLSKEGFVEFVQHHKWDTFAYLVLFFGLLTMVLFTPFIGALLVGLILGIYFAADMREKFEFFKDHLDNHGIFKSFVIVAAVVALLIASPGLCIGTVFGAFLRPLLGKNITSPFDKNE